MLSNYFQLFQVSIFSSRSIIMNGKIRRCFLIAFLLFIRPSSGFFKDKCNIDLEPTKLFGGKIQAKDVIAGAGALLKLLQDNSSFEERVPGSTYRLIVDIVRNTVVPAINLDYVGAGIYGAAVLLTSYCYTIHSSKLLAEAQSIDIDLNIMIDEEVVPILQYVEGLLNGDIKNLCDAEIKLKKMLRDRILKIQTIRNNIKDKRQEAIEGEEQRKYLKLGLFVTGIVLFSAAAFGVPAKAALYGGILIIVVEIGVLESNQNPFETTRYQRVLELLYQAEIRAIEAEKILTMSGTKIETVCFGLV